MKPLVAYIVIVVGSLIASVLIVFAAYKAKPELFVSASKANSKPVQAVQASHSAPYRDTTKITQKKAPDSTITVTPQSSAAALQDSVKALLSLLALEAEKTKQLENSKEALPQPTTKDSVKTSDPKAMAKMLDGIKPEQAVKIVNNLSNKEVKELLPLLNKRQAGKILSALDPSRAAKIIR